jgi:carboxyl-terminal processing protease
MNKGTRITVIVITVLLIVAAAFSGGFVSGIVINQLKGQGITTFLPSLAQTNSTTQATTVQSNQSIQDLFKPFWQAWDLVHQLYVDQPVDNTKLMRGAIQGMLQSLGDKHTGYIEPEILQQENAQLSGEYEGIGAYVDTSGEFLTITSPMPGSPAEKAGLKPGDIVIKIDGEDMTGKDGQYALKKVLGPKGTIVTLTIQREGVEQPFEVKITREKIEIASVISKMLDGNIGYVQITTFGDKTAPELKKALQELLKQKPVGIVVDLRYNGGGFLTSAVDVGSQFLSSGVLMYEQYGSGEMKEYNLKPGGLVTDLPIVVLVNEGTASASEIVAGAIQDTGRGKLVGVTTYGKGSVQNWIDLDNNQGAVRITIARWLTPNKRQINGVGLTPDVEIKLTDEDIKNLKDVQLDKAIEVLKAVINSK